MAKLILDYVTPTELAVALNELDKKQESRLYTVTSELAGKLEGRMDSLA